MLDAEIRNTKVLTLGGIQRNFSRERREVDTFPGGIFLTLIVLVAEIFDYFVGNFIKYYNLNFINY